MTHFAKPLFAVAVLASAAASSFAAEAKLDKLEIKKEGQGVDIIVSGENLPEPKIVKAYNGESYILDFDAYLLGKPEKVNLEISGLKYVERVWFQKRTRIHLKFGAGFAQEPEVAGLDGKWHIRINLPPLAESNLSADEREMVDAIKRLSAGLPPIKKDEKTGYPTLPLPTPDADKKNNNGGATTNPGPKPNTTPNPPVGGKPANESLQAQSTQGKISLDFVNTDVVQILKALSLESGFNIVTAPDVSPEDKPTKITIRLNNESIDNALGMVTAISGLRYARVGQTFIVTRKENFAEVLREIIDNTGGNTVTKVVNLMSGEGMQIKNAVLQAIPPTGRNGYYDIIVQNADGQPVDQKPTTPVTPAGSQTNANLVDGGIVPQPQPQPQGAGGQKNASPDSFFSSRAYYMMVVGDPLKVQEVERYIRSVDSQILQTYNINWDEDIKTVVVPIVSGQVDKIKQLLNERIQMSPRARQITVAETNAQELMQGDVAQYMLMMVGPASELDALERFARSIDQSISEAAGIGYSPEDRERIYHVADLKYLEPLVAEQDLKGRVRGLHVTVVPDPVTPGMSGEDESKKSELPDPPTGGNGQNNGGGTNEQNRSDLKRTVGREPMKLMLRGTRQQINEALEYLALVDVPRRQAALELRVLELTKEEAQRIGIDWSLLTGGKIQNIRINQGSGDTSATPGTISGKVGSGSDVVNFLASLDKALENRSVIARPNTFVADGASSNLFVGDTVRYIQTIQSTQNGTTVQIGEVKTGVNLTINARIGGDGVLNFMVDQQFTILNGFTGVPGGGQIPQTSDRKTTTLLQMRSGEAVAIGGLIQDQDRNRVSGIPFLMDLPIIGSLFKRTEKTRVRTEIVFILAATEVTDSNRETEANPRTSLGKTSDIKGDQNSVGPGTVDDKKKTGGN